MDETFARQQRIWHRLGLFSPALKRYFRTDLEPLSFPEPVMLICNHVTNLDPVFLFLASPALLTMVASDNILRNHPTLRGWMDSVFGPIYRRKGVSAVDTCRKVVRAGRAGKTVCLFAEGETTWNGRTGPVRAGTAALVRASGLPLVTYRLSGGYCSAPRWGKGFRRGRITGRITGTLSPEEVRAMDPDRLERFIEEGIRENAWESLKKAPLPCRGSHRADQIDALLFLCPSCGRVGSLKGVRGSVRCTACGLEVPLDQCLLPGPGVPFATLEAWDDWQVGAFEALLEKDPALCLREDRQDLTLWEVPGEGAPVSAGRGGLEMDGAEMRAGETRFPLGEITDLALLQNRKMAIAWNGRYFELHAPEAVCFRKYVLRWKWALAREK